MINKTTRQSKNKLELLSIQLQQNENSFQVRIYKNKQNKIF